MLSDIRPIGEVQLPEFSGTRIQMMPVNFQDPTTMPREALGDLAEEWHATFDQLFSLNGGTPSGIGFLTLDEKIVEPGRTHRRGGLHCDGASMHGSAPSHPSAPRHGSAPSHASASAMRHPSSPPGPSWAVFGSCQVVSGMIVISSKYACDGYVGELDGTSVTDGDCEHLRDRLGELDRVEMAANTGYWCNSDAIHESLPTEGPRQFVRLSMPSVDSYWYDCYTPNPTGLMPEAQIVDGSGRYVALAA